MNQVLSQSEVDALLAAVSDGDVTTSDNGGGAGGAGWNRTPLLRCGNEKQK